MLSVGVTNVSKKRQVRRAMRRRSRASCSEMSRRRATVGDRLAQKAITGAASQSNANGTANGQTRGTAAMARSEIAKPSTAPPAICRYELPRPGRGLILDCAAVVHSSRWRCVTKSR